MRANSYRQFSDFHICIVAHRHTSTYALWSAHTLTQAHDRKIDKWCTDRTPQIHSDFCTLTSECAEHPHIPIIKKVKHNKFSWKKSSLRKRSFLFLLYFRDLELSTKCSQTTLILAPSYVVLDFLPGPSFSLSIVVILQHSLVIHKVYTQKHAIKSNQIAKK